jgi:hypothetical protein
MCAYLCKCICVFIYVCVQTVDSRQQTADSKQHTIDSRQQVYDLGTTLSTTSRDTSSSVDSDITTCVFVYM